MATLPTTPLRYSGVEISGLSSVAQDVFRERVDAFAADLMAEAGRIEAGANGTGKDPEITGQIIQDADTIVRKNLRPKRRDVCVIVLHVVSAAALILVGLSGNQLTTQPWPVVFVLAVVVSLVAYMIALSREAH